MRGSLLICATCLLVTGCSAQYKFPSLSSALSSLTGFGSSSAGSSSGASNGQSSSSPYSGLVRDYGRNLMMAMSSIYPSIFKPPQAQQSAQPQQQQQAQSPFEQFAASQPLQSLLAAATGGSMPSSGSSNSAGSSGPSFSFGGSTFSISPSLPFGSLGGLSSGSQQPQGPPSQQFGASNSPFSGSFGSSINSPPAFGPLSSSPFGYQSHQMPSFAPASSYSAAFEAANGGPNSFGSQQAGGFHSAGPSASPSAQSSGPFQSLQSNFGASSFDSSAGSLLSPSGQQQQSMASPSFGASGPTGSSFMSGIPPPSSLASHQQAPQAAASAPHASPAGQSQFGHHHTSQFRPEMMSIAASAPVPSSNSYTNYGNIPSGPNQQAQSVYQQPSYR